jgi:3-oxoacyl-[acyl-carrier protein] reductase
MSFENKVTLISGASRGIGQAIAQLFGQQGAIVIGTATTEQGAATISERFKTAGIKGQGVVLNVADADSISRVVDRVSDSYGSPAILINNAAVTQDNLLLRMTDQQWDDVINTNLSSIYRMCKACLRGMVKQRYGRIINISSVSAFLGNPGQTNYSASKAGMIGFTKSLAQEVANPKRDITVNAVAPGFVETDMTKNIAPEHAQQMKNMIALGRLAQPEEIASAVVFLASDGAAYITGETIHVNGGLYMN